MSKQFKILQLPAGVPCVVPDSAGSMTRFVIEEQGDWFEQELSAVRTIVRPGWRCVDVGAGYGVYALQFAKLVGPDGRVIAVEPQAELCSMLRRSSIEGGCDSWLTVHEQAVSRSAEVDLALTSPNDPELASLSVDGDRTVDITTLDTLVSDPVNFLKVDVEGHESEVLAGAERVLSSPDIIVQVALRSGGRLQVKLCDELQQRGFCLYRVLPGLKTIVPIRIGDPVDSFLMNIFAMRPHVAKRLRSEGLIAGCVTEEDWISAGIKVQAVLDRLLAALPFVGMGLNWQPNPIHLGWEAQRRAVALAVEALSDGKSPDQRFAGLLMSYRSVKQAVAQTATGSRLFTLARIAWSLGWQVEAMHAIEKLTSIIDAKEADILKTFTEPMLLPHPTLDQQSFPDVKAVATCSIVECLVMFGSHSVFFNRGAAVAISERLRSLAVRTPRGERTLALLGGQEAATPVLRL